MVKATLTGLAVLLVMTLLPSCEEVVSTTVDPYMNYVLREIDLSGELPKRFRETVLEPVVAGAQWDQHVFILLVRPDESGPDVVVMLAGDAPAVRVLQESTATTTFDTRPFRRTDGGAQIGNLVYDVESRTLSNGPRLERSFEPVLTRDSYEVFYIENGDTVTYNRYNEQWLFVEPGPEVTHVSDVGITGERFFDTLDVRSVTGQQYSFFLHGHNIERNRSEVWISTVDYAVSPLPGDAVRLRSETVRPDSLRSTQAGVIARDDDGSLVRFDAETGALIDSFTPYHDRREPAVVFDPEGAFYLMLDEDTRILYKVAPWW